MKVTILLLLIIIMLFTIGSKSQEPGNYEIVIQGKKYSISLGKEYEINLESGETIRLTVNKKAIVAYEDGFIAFQHKRDLTISTTDLGDGVSQTVTATALGTMVLVQEYSNLNPSSVVDLMVQELTKEEIDYGYELQKEEYIKTLRDGTRLSGKKAILKYKDEETNYTVLAFGKRDSGILVVTKIDKENIEADQQIIDMFWDSLQIKF